MSQVVVITGASAGIGRAVARMYGDRGAAVALLARNREALEQAKGEVEERGGRAIVIECDVSDAAAVEAAAARAESELGPIEVCSFAPGLLDHYLARVGFDGQPGDEPEDPRRADNLFETPGDRGAHGPFDDQAAPRSPHLWSNTHRGAIGGALAAAALFGLVSLLRRR